MRLYHQSLEQFLKTKDLTPTPLTSHKFVGSVETIFKNLPKPLEWRCFSNSDLPLLMDFCEEVQEVSIQLSLTQLGLDPECKWTQGALAQRLGVTRAKVAQIVNNTNFGEINTLLSQGRDLDYIDLLKDSGWEITHIVDCPMSTQRFHANIVAQMQKNRTLGVLRRSLSIGRKK